MDNTNFIVSARKYRPATFSTVVGQKSLTATLKNAIATDRLAHSYLFCGSRGVGKTSCARIFAKTINCENRTPDGDPCNQCESCRSFNEGRSLNIIELDAASNNGVDDMRNLTEQVLIPPTEGRYRVFIIDEVHMLSTAAFNAFLKTLEEPPSYVIFILATTEKHKIIPTILSRCQIYDFNRITVKDIVEHLAMVAAKEGVKAEEKALAVIASQSDGAMRDALSIFDQIVASSRGNVTYENTIENLNILDNKYYIRLLEAFSNSDVADSLIVFKEIRDKGFNTHSFIHGLQSFMRDLMMALDTRLLPLLDATDEEKTQLAALASKFKPEFFYMALSLINDADLKYREASNKTFLIELLLIKLCQLLSPSPVFRGKEEGHIDSLNPLGSMPKPKAVIKNTESETQEAPTPTHVQEAPVNYKKETPPVSSKLPPQPMPRAAVNGTQMPFKATPVGVKVISINGGDNISDKDTNKVPEPTAKGVLSQESLIKAWEEFIRKFPEKKIMVSTMRGVTPSVVSLSPQVIKVEAKDRVKKSNFEQYKGELLSWLKSELDLSGLDLEIELVENNTIDPQMWSEREVLENMIASNPDMEKFMKDLGLSLT